MSYYFSVRGQMIAKETKATPGKLTVKLCDHLDQAKSFKTEREAKDFLRLMDECVGIDTVHWVIMLRTY